MRIWKTLSSRTVVSRRAVVRRWSGFGAILLLLGLALAPLSADAVASEPRDFVETLGNRTVAILADRTASDAERLAGLSELLTEATDFDLISRLVMGRHWRSATDAQKVEIGTLLEQLVISAMSERLDAYDGQTFEITGVNTIDERDTMVATLIDGPTFKQPFKVEWRVRDLGGSMALIDIVAEGISMIVTQRSEVSEVITRSGIDGLIAEIKNRIERGDITPS